MSCSPSVPQTFQAPCISSSHFHSVFLCSGVVHAAVCLLTVTFPTETCICIPPPFQKSFASKFLTYIMLLQVSVLSGCLSPFWQHGLCCLLLLHIFLVLCLCLNGSVVIYHSAFVSFGLFQKLLRLFFETEQKVPLASTSLKDSIQTTLI